MTLEEFTENETETERVSKPLNNKLWRRQMERVCDAYYGECEKYRREVKTLQEQVNEMARAISEFKKK